MYGSDIIYERNNGINISLEDNNQTVVYKFDMLPNDFYDFTTSVQDYFGNKDTFNLTFLVNASTIGINIIEPPNGWSSTQEFDVVLSPSIPALCWYFPSDSQSPSVNPNTGIYVRNFDLSYMNAGNINYKIINVSDNLGGNFDGNTLPLYVRCQNLTQGMQGLELLYIYRDTTPPIIEYLADPNPLTDIGSPIVSIIARTPASDPDEIGCEIMTLVDDGELVGSPYYVDFDNITIGDISTYKQENIHPIDFTYLWDSSQLNVPHNFSYKIRCENKAGLNDSK